MRTATLKAFSLGIAAGAILGYFYAKWYLNKRIEEESANSEKKVDAEEKKQANSDTNSNDGRFKNDILKKAEAIDELRRNDVRKTYGKAFEDPSYEEIVKNAYDRKLAAGDEDIYQIDLDQFSDDDEVAIKVAYLYHPQANLFTNAVTGDILDHPEANFGASFVDMIENLEPGTVYIRNKHLQADFEISVLSPSDDDYDPDEFIED